MSFIVNVNNNGWALHVTHIDGAVYKFFPKQPQPSYTLPMPAPLPPDGPPQLKEIRKVARAAISILAAQNISSCLFGSTAASLYGVERVPNDVDLVVLSEGPAEDIKRILVRANKHFYLKKARDPEALYKVLYFSLPTRPGAARRRCKVDILIPNIVDGLNIPAVPESNIDRIDRFRDLPIMPFLSLLLLKLQGWTDHLDAEKEHHKAKAKTDVDDIEELLEISTNSRKPDLMNEKEAWIPHWFIQESQRRVYRFIDAHPHTADDWSKIGFYTGQEES